MWKRRKLQKKFAGSFLKIALLGIIVLVFSLIFFSIRSGWFTIKQVEVETTEVGCASYDQLKNASGLLGQNFFLINSSKIVGNLQKKLFCIKSAVVSKRFPDQVKLQVWGRQPFAVFISLKEKEASLSSLLLNIASPAAEQIESVYTVDNEGAVFSEDVKIASPKVYMYNLKTSLGGKLADAGISALKILDKVKTLGINVDSSWIYDDLFIVIPNTVKPKIIFRLNNSTDVQLASLQLIFLEAKIDLKDLVFIDLRFDKPLIKAAPKK